MNIQYAIYNDTVYILEANPRASRTVPLVSKVCGISMARLATQIMLGKKLKDLNLEHRKIPHYGVKEAVLPFYFYPEVDPILGPEMRSTGEVLGMADSFGAAFYKAQDATKSCLPLQGCVLITVADRDKQAVAGVARRFAELGFSIVATSGTRDFLRQNGVEAALVNKMHESRPHIVDCIKNGDVQLVINTPFGKSSKQEDSSIRKAAISHRIPYVTTVAAALSAVKGIEAFKQQAPSVKSLQGYHADIGCA
jgi:carbamoyl-phosphate synthase large subunit